MEERRKFVAISKRIVSSAELQDHLKIGYTRTARLRERLREEGLTVDQGGSLRLVDDDEQKKAVEGILKAKAFEVKLNARGTVRASKRIAQLATHETNLKGWNKVEAQIHQLPLTMRKAVAEGMPYNRAGIETPDPEQMFGSPAKDWGEWIKIMAEFSVEEELRKNERKHQWSMNRLTVLTTILAALIAGVLGYVAGS